MGVEEGTERININTSTVVISTESIQAFKEYVEGLNVVYTHPPDKDVTRLLQVYEFKHAMTLLHTALQEILSLEIK